MTFWRASLLLCLVGAAVPAADLWLGEVTIAAGGAAEVAVNYAGRGAQVTAIQFDLAFDDAALRIGGSAGPAATRAGKDLSVNDKRFLIAGLNQNPIGDGVLVTLRVAAVSSASGSYPIQFTRVVATDKDSRPVAVTAPDGAVRVEGSTAGPLFSAEGVLNGASFDARISGGSFLTIYGRNFTDRETGWDSAISDGKLPTSLGGVRVRINQKDAYLNYAAPGQLNVLAPPDAGVGPVAVEVTTARGSAAATVSLSEYSPAFFGYVIGGKFHPAALFANTAVYVAPAGALAGVSSRPARPGDHLQLYATGLGATDPPYPAGQVLARPYPVQALSRLQVTVGGIPAVVEYAGMTFAGVFQVNIQVPEGVASGDQLVVLTIAGHSSQANAVLSIQ